MVKADSLAEVIISPKATILEAIGQLDRAGTGALLLCEEDMTLCGMLTDGDVRRAILRQVSFRKPCSLIATPDPIVASPDQTPQESLRLMNYFDVNQLPVVDGDAKVAGLLLRSDLIASSEPSAVIMAGGQGKRLRPLTEHVPKPMLPVGDRPLLELTIERLRKAGIHRVNITTHYLAESIKDHFGDGKRFGMELHYVNEDHPLGTAGGLRLVGEPEEPLLVINGDILTGVNFQDLVEYHRALGADVTIGVRKYELQVPYGVVECSGPRVVGLTEKPQRSFMVNAGIYLLKPVVFRYMPGSERFDMTDLVNRLLEEGRHVVVFPITEYWLDVGQHSEYQKAQEDIKRKAAFGV